MYGDLWDYTTGWAWIAMGLPEGGKASDVEWYSLLIGHGMLGMKEICWMCGIIQRETATKGSKNAKTVPDIGMSGSQKPLLYVLSSAPVACAIVSLCPTIT
jgi:hypothetical protein